MSQVAYFSQQSEGPRVLRDPGRVLYGASDDRGCLCGGAETYDPRASLPLGALVNKGTRKDGGMEALGPASRCFVLSRGLPSERQRRFCPRHCSTFGQTRRSGCCGAGPPRLHHIAYWWFVP